MQLKHRCWNYEKGELEKYQPEAHVPGPQETDARMNSREHAQSPQLRHLEAVQQMTERSIPVDASKHQERRRAP